MDIKTAAIIAEYNPFHNGHAYQIEETRRITGADFILVLMSGDFVQRGAPAVFNKYVRTKMALLGGADAVIELPSLYAVSSAEFFAGGSICLLNQLGIADFLSFGSESGNIDALLSCARLLVHETSEYKNALSSFLKEGASFPAARAHAVKQLSGNGNQQETFASLLSAPNNILALEYCKALLATDSPIVPVTVKRQGAGYHEQSLCKADDRFEMGMGLGSESELRLKFSSASAIRHVLERMGENEKRLKSYIPENIFHFLSETDLLKTGALSCDDFSSFLHYKLLMEREKGFDKYLDCGQELSSKIIRNLPAFTDFTGFCSLLKSKNITAARVSRVLTHILLGITSPESFHEPLAARNLPAPYARLLGFNKKSTELLSVLKKNSSIPLISKLANAPCQLLLPDGRKDEEALHMLEQDILASDIYEAAFARKYKKEFLNERKQSPVIL